MVVVRVMLVLTHFAKMEMDRWMMAGDIVESVD